MFSNLLFLAIVLLITTLAPAGPVVASDVLLGFATYAATLALIALQNRSFELRGRVAPALFMVNIELVCSLTLFWFLFSAQEFLSLVPGIGSMQTPRVILALLQYFGGLAVFYWTAYRQVARYPSLVQVSRSRYIEEQLRFLAPFTLPFLVFSIVGDLFTLLPQSYLIGNNDMTAMVVSTMLSVLLLGAMMIFFPAILTYCWQCQHLPEGPMKQRLEALCQRIGFKHAGILTWPVMQHSLTAAIIGIVARFRYVMFTHALLEKLSPESVEAVLIHEIGHNRRRHLIIYPFIILGAMVIIAYLSLIALPAVDANLMLKHHLEPMGPWDALRPAVLFVTYVIVVTLYFRFVFGFFSRLFERQADLTVFDVGVPPQHMINALDEVGSLSGNIHDHPSWHHFSIRQRMNFLQQAAADPGLVTHHHRRVRAIVTGYLAVLAVATLALMSTSTTTDGILRYPREGIEHLTSSFDSYMNDDLRHDLAAEYLQHDKITGNQDKITKALEYSLKANGALEIPGVAELFAADILLENDEPGASAQFMILAWQRFDIQNANPEVIKEFRDLSAHIVQALNASDPGNPLAKQLQEKAE